MPRELSGKCDLHGYRDGKTMHYLIHNQIPGRGSEE
jgi:hypothetical protein